MPFHDLHVAYTQDHAALSNTLLFAKELDYDTIALSVTIAGKLPTPLPTIPKVIITGSDGLRLLTRLTLTISDTTHNHRLPALVPQYDLIALRPTTEKALQHCCSSLECDIISIDFSQRLPFVLRFKTVASALQRGVRFEICYSSGIVAGSDARRNLISGAAQLIRATRGRGVLVSSEARSAIGLRGPWDVINLAQVWGLSQQRAKEAICEEAGKVVRLAGMRRTSYRGVVDIVDGGAQTSITGTARSIDGGKQMNQVAKDKNVLHQGANTLTNATKRKASTLSLNSVQPTESPEERTLSKREMKRRAKKARHEGKTPSIGATKDESNTLPITERITEA